MSNKLSIAWIPPSRNLTSASFRLRVTEIMKGLRDRGHICSFYGESADPDVLVVSKKYDLETQTAMELFRTKNRKGIIIFDLCDNHFYTDSQSLRELQDHEARVKLLQRALLRADAVTTSSEYLARAVVDHAGIDPQSIFTIDDCYETIEKSSRPYGFLNLLAEIRFRRLKRRLNRANKPTDRFVWFGTHGVSYAEGGMFDLLARCDMIADTFRESNRSLTIISNSHKKYREVSKALNIQTHYLPWNQHTIGRALRLHTFLLLPIKASPFTSSKSTNRPITAMLNKLLVVCDLIPSYEKLREYLISPIEPRSLLYALSMSEEERTQHIKTAIAHVHQEYSIAHITER